MVCVGIDVAKDKHDCCILDSEGTTLVDCFTIPNNMDGFKSLLQTIQEPDVPSHLPSACDNVPAKNVPVASN